MSNLTLALTGVPASGAVNSVGAPGLTAFSVPVPQLAISGVGAIPAVRVVMPTPVLAITGTQSVDIAFTMPTPVLAVTGLVSAVGAASLDAPVPRLAIVGLAGAVGGVVLAPPLPVLVATGGNGATLAMPSPQLAIVGRVGVVGGVSLTAIAPSLVVAGMSPNVAAVTLAPPPPVLLATGVVGNAGAVVMQLRQVALAIAGYSGTVGNVTLAMPAAHLAGSGYENTSGVVVLTMPMLQLRATGRQGVGAAPAALVMHTEAQTLTTYSNYPFNSLVAFNGVYLGASDAGIFALSGDTDNAALIQAAARVGMTDFGTSHLKRVDRVYVGYRTSGELVLRVFTDEVNQRDYLLTPTGKAGLHGNHARFGKGLVARYWQFEVRNRQGADFSLDMIELKPTPLRRRVGGGDA